MKKFKEIREVISKIRRGQKLQKKDIPHIPDHIRNSYIDKKILARIDFDSESIYQKKTGHTLYGPRDFVNKMNIDQLIKSIEKKVSKLKL